jgi:hypothetical protein
MKNKAYNYLILPFFCLFINLHADHVITMFLEPYPLLPETSDAQLFVNKLKKPGKIAKMQLKTVNSSPDIKGIFATYGGFLDMSNYNGQISFPKKHITPMVYILITEKITPVMMAGSTIHHWEIEQNTDAKMYKAERLHDESEETYYWLVQEVPLPKDNRIPLESITILAKPKNIFVPEGVTLTQDTPNLIVPSIFVKKGIKINTNALYILNLRQFFGQLYPIYKKEPTSYLSQIRE